MYSKYAIALMCCAIPYAGCTENQNECVRTKEFAKALLPDENGILVIPEKYTEISNEVFQFRCDIKSWVEKNAGIPEEKPLVSCGDTVTRLCRLSF